MTEELRTAGTPNIHQLSLVPIAGDPIDLTPLLIVCNIFEDMFSPVLTGNISILDNIGLFDKLPICGQEKIIFKISTWGYASSNLVNYLHRTFDIVKITDVDQVNDYTKSFTLHFASPELRKSESIKISRGFTDVTLSNIVASVMTETFDEGLGLEFESEEYKKEQVKQVKSPYLSDLDVEYWALKEDDGDSTELFVEKTKYTEPAVSFPFMKPLNIISWLATRAVRYSSGRNPETNSSANFLFFENKRGYQFVSLDTLFESKDFETTIFEYGAKKQNISPNPLDNTRINYPERITKLQIQNCYDILSNLKNGLYASRLYSYDISTGQTQEFDFNYMEHFKTLETSEKTFEGYPDYPSILHNDSDLSQRFLANRMFIVQSPSADKDCIVSVETERKNANKAESGPEEYIQRRISDFARLNNFRVIFEIAGNTKHKVGDCVYIDLKTWYEAGNLSVNKTIKEKPSKYYSGHYLITSIKHTITKYSYGMTIEAAKDAYRTKIGKD